VGDADGLSLGGELGAKAYSQLRKNAKTSGVIGFCVSPRRLVQALYITAWSSIVSTELPTDVVLVEKPITIVANPATRAVQCLRSSLMICLSNGDQTLLP